MQSLFQNCEILTSGRELASDGRTRATGGSIRGFVDRARFGRPRRSSILRRRIATIAVGLTAASLFVHVMFGDNGMVVYKQKRADYQALRKQIVQVQQENDRYTQQIQGLKSDQKSHRERSARAAGVR